MLRLVAFVRFEVYKELVINPIPLERLSAVASVNIGTTKSLIQEDDILH
jgi:hypothetical protein